MGKLSVFAGSMRAEYRLHGGLSAPEFWVISVYRFGQFARGMGGVSGVIASKLYGLLSLGVFVTTNCTVHREAQLGDGCHIVHAGGIRIHPAAVLGARVGLMHDVTIGTNMDRDGAPTIGDDVFIGAGAKLLGPINVGAGARIAANSVVLCDVPAGTTAIGVPARIVRYTGREGGSSGPELMRERTAGGEPS